MGTRHTWALAPMGTATCLRACLRADTQAGGLAQAGVKLFMLFIVNPYLPSTANTRIQIQPTTI